jgi:tetratricopeptide (TPR) repeat protein
MTINDAIANFSSKPFDANASFWVAREYEALGQTAAAISFYLRTAEYGYETFPGFAYNSLLRMSKCFEVQSNRELTVSGALLQAIALMPDRPEAYFLMSQFFEKTQQWQESYTWAVMGKSREALNTFGKLPVAVGYDYGKSFIFQIAVSSYWLGRQDRSLSIFKDILEESETLEKYKNAVNNNLERLDDSI